MGAQRERAGCRGVDYEYTRDGRGNVTMIEAVYDEMLCDVQASQSFDGFGRRDTLWIISDEFVNYYNGYEYDALSRMTRIYQSDATAGLPVTTKRVDLSYQADGQFARIERYNESYGGALLASTNYAYDGAGRLSGMVHSQAGSTIAGYGWRYDAANRVTQFLSTIEGISRYAYDRRGQLLSADYHPARNENSPNESYAYDANGNRTAANGETVTSGQDNQITNDGIFGYVYDEAGNRLYRTAIETLPSGEDVSEYVWDHRNRLQEVKLYDDHMAQLARVEYSYDVFNRLTTRKEYDADDILVKTENFIYDGTQIAMVVDADGVPQQWNLWGPAVDMLLATETFNGLEYAGTPQWMLGDNQGTIRDRIDATGQVLEHLTYDAFGRINYDTAPFTDSQFFYTGRYLDPVTGLQWHLNRWYDPSTGGWIGPDPIKLRGGDPNFTRYVGNGPANGVDPSGLIEKEQLDFDRVIKSAKAGIARHNLSAEERQLRTFLVQAALNHKIGFDAQREPDPDYYEWSESESERVLIKGKAAEGIHSRVYNLGKQGISETGCRMAVKSIMLEAVAQLAKEQHRLTEFDDKIAGNAVDKRLFKDEASTDLHTFVNAKGELSLPRLIPGDRLRMPNHRFKKGIDETGGEGSNVLYLGTGAGGQHLFVDMTGRYFTYSELQFEVSSYSKPERRDKPENYKFGERYKPCVPSWLKTKGIPPGFEQR